MQVGMIGFGIFTVDLLDGFAAGIVRDTQNLPRTLL